ncbi:MAG TPA: GNAT family N-acetyltransferase [Candidatus Nitrosocosmicus sp.]|nr:GNAT family N-acetyltransferase [Candidatus Nitrosocosmicus sp.]
MKINILKRKTKQMKDFDKKEWKYHDEEHYGREVTWDTKVYYLKACDDKNEILGTMELKVEGGIGVIRTLIVAHDRMRQGIGKSLILQAEEITKKQNGHKLHLFTGKPWQSVPFYQSVGFKITSILPDHYWHVDFVEMSKLL